MSTVLRNRRLQAIFVLVVVAIVATAWGQLQPRPAVTSQAPSQAPLRPTAEPETTEEDGEEDGEEGEVEGGDEVQNRQTWFYEQRVNAKNVLPKGAWLRAQRQANRLINPLAVQTTPLQWAEVGPRPVGNPLPKAGGGQVSWHYGGSTPYSGRVTAIATDPTNKDIAYLGSANGGVWKTTNGGVDWAPVFDPPAVPALTSQAIGAIAIDPQHADTVYVGTGEANFGGDSYFGSGLYRTTNGGGKWDKLGGATFDECHFSGIVVQAGTPNTILVAVTNYGVGTPGAQATCGYNANTLVGRGGIYRTQTGGVNPGDWTRVRAGIPTDLAVAPNNANVVYAGLFNEGVWRSDNFGGNWTNKTPSVTAGIGRVELTVVRSRTLSNNQTVYAAIAESATSGTRNRDLKGIYGSDNSGDGWRALAAPVGYTTTEMFCRNVNNSTEDPGQCWYDLTLAADPTNPALLYAGGTWLNQYSSDTQRQVIGHYTQPGSQYCPYSAVTTYCIHVDFHAMAWDAGHRLWVGSDGGIYRTSDPSAAFVLFDNLNAKLNNIQYYPGVSGSLAAPPLVGGAQDNASSAIVDPAVGFQLAGYGDGLASAVVGTNPKVALVTSQYLSIQKIYGGTFCNTTLDSTGIAYRNSAGQGLVQFNAPLISSPGFPSRAYAGTFRVYRSDNAATNCGQTSWQQISQNFTRYLTALGAATDGRTVYAGDDIGNVYVTTDATQVTNWNVYATGAGRKITDIFVMPGAPGTAYVTTSGFDGNGNHILKTTNFGANWQDISDLGPSILPNSPANAVVVDTGTNPVTVYVGTDNGVFWTNDGGQNWQNTSVGLPRTIVNDLLLDGSPKKLIAATYGRGMWVANAIGTAPAGPAHDYFANARQVTAIPYTDSGVNTANATTENLEITDPNCTTYLGKSVWYRFSPSTTTTVNIDTAGSDFDTVLLAYRGLTIGGLTQLDCNDAGQADKLVNLRVEAGQTYYFQIAGWKNLITDIPTSGNLKVSITEGAPLHDLFANARAVGALPYSDSAGTNLRAGTETSEVTALPAGCSNAGSFIGKTVWYRYAPASNVTVTADTIGSEVNFDTVLVAWEQTGSTIAALSRIGCDDDGGDKYPDPNGGSSKLPPLSLLSGHTYYFQVGGWGASVDAADSGAVKFNLKVSATGNDLFANAIAIGALALPYTDAGRSTVNAGTDNLEPLAPSCVATGEGIGKTVWYKFTPTSNMTVTADTIGSSTGFDTLIVIYTGTGLGALTERACDDDSAGNHQSRITSFSMTAGTTYYFQVGGWKSAAGTPYSGSLTFHLKTP